VLSGEGNFLFFFFQNTHLTSGTPKVSPVMALGIYSLKVRWPGRETDNSPRGSAKVKNEWSYSSACAIRFHAMRKGNIIVTLRKARKIIREIFYAKRTNGR
jgi:hypothetical protein